MAFGSAAVLPESTEDFSINAFAQQSEIILPTGDVRLPQAVEIELPQWYTLPQDAKQKLDASFSAEDSLVRRTLSPYVYKCLSNYKNGCMLQRFYNDLVDAIEDMWYTSGDLKENDLGLSEDKKYLRMVGYSKYGLSKYEAMTIFNFMSISCPMSFYINETYYNFTNGSLGFVPKDEYVSGEERTSWNNKVMQYIKSYDSVLKGKTTMYQKALAVHDELVRRIEYAFIPGTSTPQSESWAHDITGPIEKKSAVCQGYSMVYSLVLNYNGGDSTYCLGETASGRHSWDLVRFDDGKYYYVDSTWDDTFKETGDEISHLYFAAGTESFYVKHNRMKGWDVTEITDDSYAQVLLPDIPKNDFKETTTIHKHSYTKKTVAPTCTEMGYTLYNCKGCGDIYRSDFKDPQHSWSDWKTTKAATCTEAGEKTRTCTACGEKETKDTEKLGHRWEGWKTTKKYSCTEDGERVNICSRCGRKWTQTIAKSGHNYKSTVVKPTCTAKGYTLHKCSRCGDSYKDTYKAATGHSLSAWKTTKKATCTEAGTQTRKCTVCGKTETRTIKATGHKFSAWKTTGFDLKNNTSAKTRKCSVCGKAEKQTTKNAVSRFAGANRYDTAALISQGEYKNGTGTVVIATGLDFHDALVAVPLANAYGAPLLLTTDKQVTKQTETELARLKAKKVIIVSTNGAVGSKVKAALANYNPTMISGKTCFETASKVATALQKKAGKAPDTIFFATDSAFADALSASPIVAVKNAPIIYLKNKGSIDSATANYLKSVKGKVKNAYIIGGDGVISDAMMKNVATALGLTVNKTVVRVAGANRYETCVAVNKKFKSVVSSDGICVAKGLDFPDALAGGVYAAKNGQALFLADGKKLQDVQNIYLKGKNASKITVFGGTGAVNDELVKVIAQASI